MHTLEAQAAATEGIIHAPEPQAAATEGPTTMKRLAGDVLTVLKELPIFEPIIELAQKSKDYQQQYVQALEKKIDKETWLETESTIKTNLKKTLKELCGWEPQTVETLLETCSRIITQFELLQSCSTTTAHCFEKPKTQTALDITDHNDSLVLQLFYALIQNSGIRSTKKEAIIRLTHKILEYNQSSLDKTSKDLLEKLQSPEATFEAKGNLNLFEEYPANEKDLLEKLSAEFITRKKRNNQDSVVITFLELQKKPKDRNELLTSWADQKGLSLQNAEIKAALFDTLDLKLLDSLFDERKEALIGFNAELKEFMIQELSVLRAPSLFKAIESEATSETGAKKSITEICENWRQTFQKPDAELSHKITDQIESLKKHIDSEEDVKNAYEKLERLPKAGHNSISLLLSTLLNINPKSVHPKLEEIAKSITKLRSEDIKPALPELESQPSHNKRIKYCIESMGNTLPGSFSLEETAMAIFFFSENCETSEDTGITHPVYDPEALKKYAASQLPLITHALKEYQAKSSSLTELIKRANTQSTGLQEQQKRLTSAGNLSGEFTKEQTASLQSDYHHPQPFSTWEILLSSTFLLLTTDDDLTEEESNSETYQKLETDMIASCIALTGSIRAGSKTLESKGSASLNTFIRKLPKNYDFETGAFDIRGMAGDLIGEEKVKKTENELLNKLPSAIHSYLIFSFAAMIFLAVSIPVFLVLLETSLFTIAQTASLALLAGSSILMTSYYINNLLYHFSGTETHIENIKDLILPAAEKPMAQQPSPAPNTYHPSRAP